MEPMRTIGYICPKCGKAVVANRTVFALQAGPAAAVCDCGETEFISETDGLNFRLTVPCGVCGGEHIAEVDAKALLQGPGIALSCPETKQLCCYIGEEGRVHAAIRELEITVGKLKDPQETHFADSVIMYEFLSELRDIAARYALTPGRPQWRENSNWAGLLIAIGNEYAPGNPKTLRQRQETIRALCQRPDMAHAIQTLTPVGMSRNKQLAARLVRGGHFWLLSQLYRIKNRI